ncbi:hypothetical protein J6590_093147 [Homalodisca vitripennis]|nr:hypothetical protein J6590_008775 [Homalodisca vitripennis]KAG8265511.1 hypothetical protein J6590_093147 [Homalodisca vitripennis]
MIGPKIVAHKVVIAATLYHKERRDLGLCETVYCPRGRWVLTYYSLYYTVQDMWIATLVYYVPLEVPIELVFRYPIPGSL